LPLRINRRMLISIRLRSHPTVSQRVLGNKEKPNTTRLACEIASLPYCLVIEVRRTAERNCRQGQSMVDRFWDIARAVGVVLLLGVVGATAQTAQPPTSPNPDGVPHAVSTSPAQASAQPASPSGPQLNTAVGDTDVADVHGSRQER
jgi:hypothetical protein